MNGTFQTLESGSQYVIYLSSLTKPVFHRLQWQIISEVDVQEVNEVNIPVNVNDESQKRSSNSDDLQNHVQVNQCLQKSESAQPGSSKQHIWYYELSKIRGKRERENGKKKGYSRMLTESPEN